MTAFAALIINDAATTPVARTFAPVKIDALGVAKFAERSGGIPVGYPVITLSLREPNKQSRNYRILGKVVLPILEQTSASTATGIQPAPSVAYNCLGTFDLSLPERCTLQNRKDLSAFIRGLMAHAVVTALVNDLDTIY